jgi:carbamate kinase
LLLMDGLSEEERNSIRRSVSDITTKILVDKEDPALER